MSARRPYVRPMRGWWMRNPFFMRYMAREATAVFVYLYGLVLVAGLVALAGGAEAFERWRAALAHPLGLAFQVISIAVFAYHTWSWFVIMPKTMPPVALAGRKVPAYAITGAGLVAAALASLAVILLALFLA